MTSLMKWAQSTFLLVGFQMAEEILEFFGMEDLVSASITLMQTRITLENHYCHRNLNHPLSEGYAVESYKY
jgi:hypothetical protein